MDKYEFREEVKKDKKTQETQYVETDEHPVQSNEISHGRIVLNSYLLKYT